MRTAGYRRLSVAGTGALSAAILVALVASSFVGAQQPENGTIVVEKQTIPDGYMPPQGGFDFSGAIIADLNDGESASRAVEPGTHTVTENLAGRPFWDLTSIECDDDDSSGNLQTLTATYEVDAGETVKCVFTNEKRGLLIVDKKTNPIGSGGDQSFAFDANYGDFSLEEGEQHGVPLPAGTYSVTELVPDGWELESATCDNGDDPEAIAMPADVVIRCTFTNRLAPDKLTPGVATDVHDANHNLILSAPVGSTVHDLARVTGSGPTPTGTVTFTVFMGSTTCSGAGESAGVIALDASGVAHPSQSRVVPPGGLSFRGVYSGDSNYTPANGPCEALAAGTLTPGVATDVHDANHNLILSAPVGSTVHDLARVTGSGPTPTGTVTFTVFMGSTTCSGAGESAGVIALDASGVAHPSQSRVVPPGGLSFRGVYSGDSNYTPANGPCEALAAGTLTPGVATDVHDANHNLILSAPVGSTVHDLARVTGSGPTPTGTVTFTVFMGSTTCSGAGESAGVIALDASGVAHPSQSRVVPPGGLSFRGVYSGDSNYTPANGPCEALAAQVVTVGAGSIDVQKSADTTTVKEPGGPVQFSVRITNTSSVDVAITNVVDDRFGDLDDSGGNSCFDVPINLDPGEFSSCQFTGQVTGSAGTEHVNVVTASGTDEFGNPVSDADDARVTITPRLIDLVIVKDAISPTPLNGVVNYSLSVTNKGPDTATNVQLADPAPVGVTYLTANPSQGSCNLSPALITCSLGSIAAGQTVTIAITGRATAVGSHTNTATVTGGGGRETNPADNVDSAVTIVPAPLKPPTVKPTPAPEVCLTLTVSQKMIRADGKPDKVTVKVTAGKKRVKGVKVSVSGAGVSKAARTNGKGVVVLTINPRKPGIITVTIVESNQKLCGPKRIGVVGVFLPPLTG